MVDKGKDTTFLLRISIDESNENIVKSMVSLFKQIATVEVLEDTLVKKVKKTSKTAFIKPSIEEIEAYCLERNNKVNPKQFYDFYESKGWYVGKNKMKDWKAAIRTWERTDDGKKKKNNPKWVDDYLKELGEKDGS